ncbi:PTS glucose/maltose transporter subunit IIBCA, partial [Streptococcus suis]
MGLIIKGSGVQAVYGPKADVLKSDIQDLLDSGVDIPTIDLEKVEDKSPEASQFKGVKDTVVSVADGEVIPITAVKDP